MLSKRNQKLRFQTFSLVILLGYAAINGCMSDGKVVENQEMDDGGDGLTPIVEDPNSFTSTAQNEDLVGEVEYDFQVIDGDALLSIPVPMPKGVEKLMPMRLSLEYRSSYAQANVELGRGWSLAGLSSIHRCPSTFAHDGKYDKIRFTSQDNYCLDGRRLFPVKSAQNNEFVTEVNDFSQIRSFGKMENDSMIFGPKYFKVKTKAHQILTYGFENIQLDLSTMHSMVRQFPLTKIEDYIGNRVEYEYSITSGYIYLKSIRYANKRVVINHEARSDTQKAWFENKLELFLDKRIKSIEMYAIDESIREISDGYVLIKSVELAYDNRSRNGQDSLLRSVSICTRIGEKKCLRPIYLDYNEHDVSVRPSSKYESVGIDKICGEKSTIPCENTELVDMNGDGVVDLVSFASDGIYVSINTRRSESSKDQSTSRWTSAFSKSQGWNSDTHLRQFVDVNGDRLPDIVGFGTDGVFVALNENGQSFGPVNKWSESFGSNNNYSQTFDSRSFADFNNDGLPDIFSFSNDGIHVSYNLGGSKFQEPVLIFNQTKSQDSPTYLYSPQVADLNADGFPDLVFVMNKLTTAQTVYSSFYVEPSAYLDLTTPVKVLATWPSISGLDPEIQPVQIHEINGLVVVRPRKVKLIDSSRLVSPSALSINPSLIGNQWEPQYINQRLFVDLNKDNVPDLVGFLNSNMFVSLGNTIGSSFSQAKSYAINGTENFDGRFKTFADVNMDGLLDLVVFKCDGVYAAYGQPGDEPFESSLKLILIDNRIKDCTPTSDQSFRRYVMDFDGDDILDFVLIGKTNLQIAYGSGFGPLKLASVRTSLDTGIRITYDKSLLENDVIQNNASYWTDSRYTSFGVSRNVVSRVEYSSSIKYNGYQYDVLAMKYSYGGQKCSTLQGRADCKFSWIEVQTEGSQIRERTEYNQLFPLSTNSDPKKTSIFYKDVLVQKDQVEHQIWFDSSTKSLVVQAVSKQVSFYDEQDGSLTHTQLTEYEYDKYSNVLRMLERTEDQLNQVFHEHEQKFKYLSNVQKWYLDQLTESEENFLLNNDPLSYRQMIQRFTYDSNTRLLIERVYLEDDEFLALQDEFNYDRFGNTVKITRTPLNSQKNGNQIRTERLAFDLYGLNMISRWNALNQRTDFNQYDFQDNLISSTDINQIVTAYKYDELGRIVEETRGNSTTTLYDYEWHSSLREDRVPSISVIKQPTRRSISAFKLTKHVLDGQKEIRLLDGSKRVVRVVTFDLDGNEIFEDMAYSDSRNTELLFTLNSLKYKPAMNQKPLFVVTKYDEFSREIERIEPAFERNYLNKMTSNLLTDGSSNNSEPAFYSYHHILTKYRGLEKIVGQKRDLKNVLGNYVRVEEADGVVATYEYDVFDNLIKVTDPTKVETLFRYDMNNNRVYFEERNLGRVLYEYNAYNELMLETNLETGKSIVYKRDLLGRVVERLEEQERETKFTYDKKPNGLGRTWKVVVTHPSSPSSSLVSYSVDYSYDQMSRETEKLVEYRSAIETKTFKLNTAYDEKIDDRVVRLSYSNNISIDYCYSAFGHLNSVYLNNLRGCNDQDSTQARNNRIWKAVEYLPDGQIGEEMLGNGVWQRYEYDSTSALRRIEASRSDSNSFVRKLEYNYDNRRNLVERRYFLKSQQHLSLSESFEYDSLDRLARATTYSYKAEQQAFKSTANMYPVSKAYSERIVNQVNDFKYDAIGNIIQSAWKQNRKTQHERILKYNLGNEKPQQLNEVNGESVIYDSTGKVSKTSAYEIDWYSFEKVKSIRTNFSTIEFSYGADNNRLIRLAKPFKPADVDDERVPKQGTGELNYYVDDLFESQVNFDLESKKLLERIDKISIRVLDRVIAFHVRQANLTISGGNPVSSDLSTFYMLNDMMNSPDTVLDKDGQVLVRYKYEPFGGRVVFFSNTTNQYIDLFNRGYTGHEYVDNGRLINMNGRWFDSVHMRFLSPDYIQDYFKPLNLNRYSYGYNNPMKYNDPSGYWSFKRFVKKITKPLVIMGATALVATGLGALGVPALLATVTTSAVATAATTFTASLIVTTATSLIETGKLPKPQNLLINGLIDVGFGYVKGVGKEHLKKSGLWFNSRMSSLAGISNNEPSFNSEKGDQLSFERQGDVRMTKDLIVSNSQYESKDLKCYGLHSATRKFWSQNEGKNDLIASGSINSLHLFTDGWPFDSILKALAPVMIGTK